MEIAIKSLETIHEAAKEFVKGMGDGKVFAFYGKMGNEYTDGNGNPIYHFDFYRIKKLEEVYDMGYEDYFYSGNLCLLEWPELIEDILPKNVIKVTIDEQPDGTRKLSC